MPLTTNLFCYLWDLEDEGIDYVLDVIQGELGAQGITVPVSHPPIDQLRPHDNASPRRFRSAGGLQFQPDLSRYQSTRARPVVAEWLKKRNPFEKLAEACHTRGLELHAWLIARYNPALIAANPSLATRDVFGESSPDTLCLVNPDVQEYLRAIADELSRGYGCEAITVENGGHAETFTLADCIQGTETRSMTQHMLSQELCFCESCHQRTTTDSINIGAAERAARLQLERILRDEDDRFDQIMNALTSTQDPIGAMFDWYGRQTKALMDSIRTLCPEHCPFFIQSISSSPQLNRPLDGVCLTDSADEILLALKLNQVTQLGGSVDRTWLVSDVGAPSLYPDATAIVRHLAHIAELGAAGVHIFNYGMLSQKRLEWVKQAIRYARRTG